MLLSGDPLDPSIAWVRPELVIDVRFAGWSGAGRMRHAVFLGIREDKPAHDVVREVADPGSERNGFVPPGPGSSKRIWHSAVPPRPKRPLPAPASGKRAEPGARKPARPATIVVAKAPCKARIVVGSVELTHPDRALAGDHQAGPRRLLAGRRAPCATRPGAPAAVDPPLPGRHRRRTVLPEERGVIVGGTALACLTRWRRATG